MLSGSSCTIDESHLQGNWQAVAFYENGHTAPAQLEPIQLEFGPGQQYQFHSIGQYREEGRFRTSLYYLFLSDTTANPPREHVVKILYLSEDTLKIEMAKDTLNQVLFFAKVSSAQ